MPAVKPEHWQDIVRQATTDLLDIEKTLNADKPKSVGIRVLVEVATAIGYGNGGILQPLTRANPPGSLQQIAEDLAG